MIKSLEDLMVCMDLQSEGMFGVISNLAFFWSAASSCNRFFKWVCFHTQYVGSPTPGKEPPCISFE